MKKLFCVLVLLCASRAVQAVTHTVGRGETLASIAERYHVTVAQLVAANPGADRLFYVGLKLEIPEVEQAAEPMERPVTAQSYVSADSNLNTQDMPNERKTEQSSDITAENFSNIFLSYSAQFDHFDMGAYGIGWVVYGKGGWGMTLACDMNYGIVDPGSLLVRVGVACGAPVHPNIMLNCSLAGCLSGYKSYKDSEFKTGYGVVATPGISFRADRLVFNLGYDLGWMKNDGSGFAHNFRVTLGYRF